MILREGDGRFVQSARLQPQIDIAVEGVERGALGRFGEAGVAIGVELSELVRNAHQLGKLLGGEFCGGGGERFRFLGEARAGGFAAGQRTDIVERFGGGEQGDHRPIA